MPEHNKGQQAINPVQVERYLGGIDYPVNKEKLVQTAKNQGADERVMNTLQQIPDQQYDSPTTVTQEIGKLT